MVTKQPEALRLAADLNYVARYVDSEHWDTFAKTTDELRRLHEVNQELLVALKAYQKAGFCNSTDYELQGEAYDLAAEAIAKAERTTP